MAVRSIRCGAGFVAMAMLATPTGVVTAQVVRSSVDLSAGAGYATNPFLVIGEDTDSAVIEASARPELRIEEESSSTSVAAYIRHQQYLERFGGNTDFGANADHRTQLNARTSVRAGVFVDSSILGGSNFATPTFTPPPLPGTEVPGTDIPGVPTTPIPPVGGIDPNAPIIDPIVDPGLIDIGLIGTRARRTSFGASLGLDHSPSARDTVSVGFSAQRSGYDDEIFGADFNQYVGNASYSRQVNEQLSVGLSGVVSIADYDDAPDATVYQPQLIFTYQLSAAYSVNGSVGVAVTQFDEFGGLDGDTRTALAFSLNGCRRQERSSFCLSGQRTATPSGFGGVQNLTAATASYSYQLGERDGLTAQVGYSRTDGSRLIDLDQDFLNASVSWTRQISERLRANATVGYRNVYSDDFDRDADISGLISIGYLLGDRR